MNRSIQHNDETQIVPGAESFSINLLLLMPGRVSSRHTQRAYYRWIDRYLADVAGLRPTTGDERLSRMASLPIKPLQRGLSAPQLRAWLGMLVESGHGKQGVQQARAAIVTLTGLLAESEWLDEYTSATVRNVRIPNAPDGQRQGRWLAPLQIRTLMNAARAIATSRNQELRNHVAVTMLCTMALRRDELSSAKWGDLSLQNNRPVLRVRGKGRKTAIIDVPKPVLRALDSWRVVVSPNELHPPAGSPLLRRLWKGGRVSRNRLTPDGIWLVINESSTFAGLGHVAPHDLRRSVAGALQEAGVPIDKISQLLRHSNVAVTERYLSKLPQRNEGAVIMSDVLGLDDDDDMLW